MYVRSVVVQEDCPRRLTRPEARWSMIHCSGSSVHVAPSQVLIASVDLGCSDEILTILAMLSAQNIFFR